MPESVVFRCTYEWDREVGKDDRGDAILKRHICNRPMGHEDKHESKSGRTSETPTTRGIK